MQLHEGLPRPKTCTHIENEDTDEDEVPSDAKALFAVWSEGEWDKEEWHIGSNAFQCCVCTTLTSFSITPPNTQIDEDGAFVRLLQDGYALAFNADGQPIKVLESDKGNRASHFEVCVPSKECDRALGLEDRVFRVWRQTRRYHRHLSTQGRQETRMLTATICMAAPPGLPPVIVEGKKTWLPVGLPPDVPPDHAVVMAVKAATVPTDRLDFEVFALEREGRAGSRAWRKDGRHASRSPRLIRRASSRKKGGSGSGSVTPDLDDNDAVKSSSPRRRTSSVSEVEKKVFHSRGKDHRKQRSLSGEEASKAQETSAYGHSWSWPSSVPKTRWFIHVLDLATDTWHRVDDACVAQLQRGKLQRSHHHHHHHQRHQREHPDGQSSVTSQGRPEVAESDDAVSEVPNAGDGAVDSSCKTAPASTDQ